MAAIAREAGISKALLYHYFPSKQAFFQATLEQAAAELAERVRPSADLAPTEQLMQGLDAVPGLDRGERDRLPQAHAERGQRARGRASWSSGCATRPRS